MNLCLNAFVIQFPDDLLDTCLVTAPRALLLPFARRGHCKGEDSYKECSSHVEFSISLTIQAQRPSPRDAWIATGARGRVRCSAWLGRVRNPIHTPQESIRVTEIREDTNSTLRGQSCRSTPRANANERNAHAATRTSIPNTVTNVNSAAKSAISLGCSLHGNPHNGRPVEGV